MVSKQPRPIPEGVKPNPGTSPAPPQPGESSSEYRKRTRPSFKGSTDVWFAKHVRPYDEFQAIIRGREVDVLYAVLLPVDFIKHTEGSIYYSLSANAEVFRGFHCKFYVDAEHARYLGTELEEQGCRVLILEDVADYFPKRERQSG